MWLQRKEMGTHIAHLGGRVEGRLIFLMKVLLLSEQLRVARGGAGSATRAYGYTNISK